MAARHIRIRSVDDAEFFRNGFSTAKTFGRFLARSR
jgi:hypothetical protein